MNKDKKEIKLYNQLIDLAPQQKLNHNINTNDSLILHHPIKFARWLLKNAIYGWEEGFLCWKYNEKYYDTDELYEEFCRQQL